MVFNNSILLGASAQSTGQAPFDPTLIGNSAWVDGSADYLTRTPSAGTTTRWIVSCWVQRTEFGNAANAHTIFSAGTALGNLTWFRFDDQDKLDFAVYQGSTTARKTSSAKFRDIGWYHLCVSFDSGSGIAPGARIQLFVNGIEVTDLSANTNTPSGETTAFNDNVVHEIGRYTFAGSQLVNAYLTQFTMLENKSFQNNDLNITDLLDSFTFGTNGSQFVPKSDADIAALASTAGGNSFCLDFSNSSSLGLDISSNANNFTPVSMSSVNQSTNTPSLTYLQLNPLNKFGTADLSEGNTRVGVDVYDAIRGTKFITSGKHYLELTINTVNNSYLGVANNSSNPSSFASSNVACLQKSGDIYINDAIPGGTSSRSKAFTDGDVVGILIDADAKKFWQSVNGTINSLDRNSAITVSDSDVLAGTGGFDLSGLTGDDGNYTIHIGNSDGSTADVSVNGGHKAFSHTPPTGYLDWGSDNYTAPEFQGIDFFDSTLYEGNGTGQRVGDFVPFTDAYAVDKSAMFDSGDLRFLARTPSSGGNEKTLTFSTWIKMTGVGNSNENAVLTTNPGSKEAQIRITGTTLATKKVQANLFNGSSFVLNINTVRTFGDTSNWNHLVVAYDSRAAVASADKVIIYFNGVRQTVTGTDLATNDYDTGFNSTSVHNIGRQTNNAIGEPDFYLAETVMIDGQQLDPTSFGQLDTATNRWVPKDVSGLTFGTNGFYLEYESTFASGSGAGTDTSGNSNNWTESTDGGTAWSTSDQFIDTPSKNYPTIRPVAITGKTYSEGNLKVSSTSTFGNGNVLTTPSMPLQKGGKWYWEIIDAAAAANQTYGIAKVDAGANASGLGGDTKSWGFYNNQYRHNGNIGAVPDSPTNTGTRYMFAVDVDAGKFWMGNDGTWWKPVGGSTAGDPAAGTNAAFTDSGIANGDTLPAMDLWSSDSATFVFTQNNFAHSVPTGFSELNQDNLDDTASKLTAFPWIKNRDAADNHMLANRVRGPQFINNSNSNSTGETTNFNAIQRFLQRGVQVGSDVAVNTALESFVLWQWLMGDSATTGSTTSPAGSIASTTIVSDANHMSIGTFTGTGSNGTVGHGLSAAPEAFVVFNPTADARFKMFFHKDSNASPASGYLHLESTEAFQADATIYNNTVPTATVFSIGTNGSINENTKLNTFIAWRSIPGVCKVGSYTGNASNPGGPYISCGFTPSWIMFKSTGTNSWTIFDTARDPINGPGKEFLHPDLSSAGSRSSGSLLGVDFLADGFRVLTTGGNGSSSGVQYIYLAMADIGGNGTLPPIYGR